jgi:2-keto-4-pentenoate hydratase/2-oxohepta-3-ene-1,7-dioic acid hydratase in catechol pathway
VIGAEGAIGGFTGLAEWRAPGLRAPKDRDFALGLGPVVVTPDEFADASGFEWPAATALAAAGTTLFAGDVLAAPSLDVGNGVNAGETVALEIEGIGTLEQRVAC